VPDEGRADTEAGDNREHKAIRGTGFRAIENCVLGCDLQRRDLVAIVGFDEGAWSKNRRGEFAIFQK
jgi:hypothetical protein